MPKSSSKAPAKGGATPPFRKLPFGYPPSTRERIAKGGPEVASIAKRIKLRGKKGK